MFDATTSGSQVLPVTVATDWWMFGAMAASAAATLAVVVVAVLDSRRANRRAIVAEARAEHAEQRQQTIDEENIRRRDEDLRVERTRILADVEKYEYWRSVASQYDDGSRLTQINADLEAAQIRLGQIGRALGEPE